jgi:predicted component of type VI protein secretion system
VGSKLEVLNAAGQVVERVPIEQRVITLGRAEGSAVRLRDPLASKTHAEISLVDGRYELKDLGSRNGSFLNEARIDKPRALEDGDVVRVGATRVRFRTDMAPPATPRERRGLETLEVDSHAPKPSASADDLATVKAATARIADATEPVTLVEELLAYFYGLAEAEAAEVVLLEPGDNDRRVKPFLRVAVDARLNPKSRPPVQFGVSRVADPNAPPLPNARQVVTKLVAARRSIEGSEVGPEVAWAPEQGRDMPARLAVPIIGAERLFGYVYVERAATRGAFSPAEAARVGIVCDALAAYLRSVLES